MLRSYCARWRGIPNSDRKRRLVDNRHEPRNCCKRQLNPAFPRPLAPTRIPLPWNCSIVRLPETARPARGWLRIHQAGGSGGGSDRGTREEHTPGKKPQNAQSVVTRWQKELAANRPILAGSALHGKEGVAGSSPAEGLRNRAVARFSCLRSGSVTTSTLHGKRSAVAGSPDVGLGTGCAGVTSAVARSSRSAARRSPGTEWAPVRRGVATRLSAGRSAVSCERAGRRRTGRPGPARISRFRAAGAPRPQCRHRVG
jgi:hypothetical protein